MSTHVEHLATAGCLPADSAPPRLCTVAVTGPAVVLSAFVRLSAQPGAVLGPHLRADLGRVLQTQHAACGWLRQRRTDGDHHRGCC